MSRGKHKLRIFIYTQLDLTRLKKSGFLSIMKLWQGWGRDNLTAIVSDPDVLACMDNYHVRLIAPARMSDEEIMKFQSSLREVMLFIKYSKDRENLSRVLATNEKRFRELERRAADVIEAITNSGIKYDESEEVVDVCQAIQEMRKESEQKKAMEVAEKLHEMGLDTEKIAKAVGYAVETVKGWLGLES